MITRGQILIFPILCILVLSTFRINDFRTQTLAQSSSILFESGFENQFNDWNGTREEYGAYVTTGNQSDGFPVHHGNYSMKSASGAISGSQSWTFKTFENVTEVYVRLYVYFPEFWTYPNAWASGNPPAWWLYFVILTPEYPIPYSRTGYYIVTQLRAMYFTSAQSGQEGWYFQGTYYNAYTGNRAYLADPEYPDQWTLSPKQWYCVEWYNKLASVYGATDGIWRLWVDGQLYYNFTDLDNRDQDYPWFGALMIGNYEVPPSTNGWDEPFPTVYIDCLNVSTEYVGPEPMIDETPPVIDSPVHEPETVMPNQNATVSVSVTDELSGVSEVTLSYSTDNGTTWTNTTMTKDVLVYRGNIPGFPSGTNVYYIIIAYDNVGKVAVNDNAGQYYVYTVIPEFPTWPMLLAIFLLITTLLALLKKKIMSPKVAPRGDSWSKKKLYICSTSLRKCLLSLTTQYFL